MSVASPRVPRPLVRRLLDVALVVWIAVWVFLGFRVADEVHGLTDLSRTTVAAGLALQDAGEALVSLGRLPVVGDDVETLGERTMRAGRSARDSGRSSRESIENLSLLLGLSVALIPSVPLLALYVPLRISWFRQVRAVRQAVERDPSNPVLTEFLARRAASNLPYDALRATTPDPWDDLANGRFQPLADAELDRLGIKRPRDRKE